MSTPKSIRNESENPRVPLSGIKALVPDADASSGMVREIARALADMESDVVINYRCGDEDVGYVVQVLEPIAQNTLLFRSDIGQILNIPSIVGLMGNIGQSSHTASRAGVIGMTESSAREPAQDHITVNTIAPEFIETHMVRDISDTGGSDPDPFRNYHLIDLDASIGTSVHSMRNILSALKNQVL